MSIWIILLFLVLMFGGLFVIDFFILKCLKKIDKKIYIHFSNIDFDITKFQNSIELLYEYSLEKEKIITDSKFEAFLIKTINKIISFFDKFLTKYKLM